MDKKIIVSAFVAVCVLLTCILTVMVLDKNAEDTGSVSDRSKDGSDSSDSADSTASLEESSVASDSSEEPSVADPSESASASEAESSEESSKEEGKKVVSFLACPDNIIHPSVYYNALRSAAEKAGEEPNYKALQTADYDFATMYENIAERIASADLAYVNVETLIGGNENKISGYPTFNSPEAAGETLIDLGFDLYNLAHNHMLDSYDDEYLINCNRFFSERGQTTLGYYENEDAADDIVIVEKNGIKIAFLAFTYGTNGISLPSGSSTFIPLLDEDLMEHQVALAKEKADFIIASVHWGTEDIYSPTSKQRSSAQKLVDLGVDVIVGMHPHVIQEAKWVERKDGSGKTFLVYSLGNLVSGMYGGKNALGAMLSFDIVDLGDGSRPFIENVLITPTVCHYTKESSVNSDDTGFRNFKIYEVEHYTEELAQSHGCHNNVSKMSIVDPLLDKSFSKDSLIKKIKEIFPSEFLPSYYQLLP